MRGEDQISISFELGFTFGDEPDASFSAEFPDLDTDRDGVLTAADEGIDLNFAFHGGVFRESLTIDAESLARLHPEGSRAPDLTGGITLFGVTTLTAADFAA